MPVLSVILLMQEKNDPDVRFHGWQGTIFGLIFWGINIFMVILGALPSLFLDFWAAFRWESFVHLLIPVVWFAAFMIWIPCAIKAYRGERWKIPYLGDFAEKKAGLA